MKQIKIKCFFADSERTIAYFMLMGEYNIKIRKIIDPVIVMREPLTGEEYDIFGKEEGVNRFIEDLKSKDYDIEVLDGAV